MNAANTFEFATTAERTDESFPYMLVSSLTVAIVSLAAVWISAALTFGAMAGA
jgi:hypothetical protein